MAWYLQPLHSPEEPDIPLPREGTVTVGRRPGNGILCKDLAVSGQHCILHCHGGATSSLAEAPEVEDCSTNGSYVNEEKVSKGQRHRMSIDDVLSLTKLPDDPAAVAPTRVQFRLVFHDVAVSQDATAAKLLAEPTAVRARQQTEVPPTAPDLRAPLGGAGGAETSFAQDLLVQEQQSKARITAQLLQSQSKLDEERQQVEDLQKELNGVRQKVDEERARRLEAEQSRDRLGAEAKTLQTEFHQLKELRASHEELKQRHEAVQLDLQSRKIKCTQLEAAQEQLRRDRETAMESHQKASQQHAELQTRSRQAQERADKLQQQYEEAKREADWAQEQSGKIEGELSVERKAREELAEQVSKTKDQVAEAEASERASREALDAASAKRAELECKANSAHSELESARAKARQEQQRLSTSQQLVERLHDAGKCLSAELKRRAEAWDKALADNNFDGLEDALASGGPTFAQVTCPVESPPAKCEHERGQDADDHEKQQDAGTALLQANAGGAEPQPMQVEAGHTALASEQSRPVADNAGEAALLSVVTNAAVTKKAQPIGDLREASNKQVEEVAIDDDEDELLAAAARSEPAHDTTAGISVGGASAALPGCSTAWSLEVLDAAPCGATSPPAAKRFRPNGE